MWHCTGKRDHRATACSYFKLARFWRRTLSHSWRRLSQASLPLFTRHNFLSPNTILYFLSFFLSFILFYRFFFLFSILQFDIILLYYLCIVLRCIHLLFILSSIVLYLLIVYFSNIYSVSLFWFYFYYCIVSMGSSLTGQTLTRAERCEEKKNQVIKPRGSANDASRRLVCPGWSDVDAHHEKSFSSPGLDPSSSTEGQLHRAPSGAECVGTHAPKQRFSKCPSGISTPHPGCATKSPLDVCIYVFFIAPRLIIFYVPFVYTCCFLSRFVASKRWRDRSSTRLNWYADLSRICGMCRGRNYFFFFLRGLI